MTNLIRRLRGLYEKDNAAGQRFRYGLLAFDVATIVLVVASSFLPRSAWLVAIDAVFGVVMLTEFGARMIASRRPGRDLMHPATWADIAAIVSFLTVFADEGAGFLRILRTLRLLRTYHLARQLERDSPFFRRNRDVIRAATHLGIFVFVMTGTVYSTQHAANPAIANYVDALYFTVTSLTTTGYGDITLPGTGGRMISVIIMIFGVTLFLRLAQVLFRPVKVHHPCPACGLQRHEPDAVHCKSCGTLLNIPDEGEG